MRPSPASAVWSNETPSCELRIALLIPATCADSQGVVCHVDCVVVVYHHDELCLLLKVIAPFQFSAGIERFFTDITHYTLSLRFHVVFLIVRIK